MGKVPKESPIQKLEEKAIELVLTIARVVALYIDGGLSTINLYQEGVISSAIRWAWLGISILSYVAVLGYWLEKINQENSIKVEIENKEVENKKVDTENILQLESKISSDIEKKIIDKYKVPVYITHWPKELKPFYMKKDEKYALFYDSLPISGVSGTLQNRFTTTAPAAVGLVRAKTGTLNGTATLAGYVESTDREYIFVALADDIALGNAALNKARAAIDRVLGRIAAPNIPAEISPAP